MNKVDTLIQNALLFDGSSAEPVVQDLAVHQGKIVGIGPNLTFTADHCVNASGLALMPGIIDSHTHYDAQITWDARVRPSWWNRLHRSWQLPISYLSPSLP